MAEIVKRRYNDAQSSLACGGILIQETNVSYDAEEDVLDPIEQGLDRIVVKRKIPAILIRLCVEKKKEYVEELL